MRSWFSAMRRFSRTSRTSLDDPTWTGDLCPHGLTMRYEMRTIKRTVNDRATVDITSNVL